MAFQQPSNAPPLDSQEHEQLSIIAAYAVLTGDEQRARTAVPDGRLELWETQFLKPAVVVHGNDDDKAVKHYERDTYLKTRGRDAAKRRIQEEEAAERGHLSGRILTYEQTCALKPPAALIPNVVYTGAVAVILGDSQVGKSWVMLSVAAAAATGSPWPTGGKDTERRQPIPVLYVAAEDGGTIAARLQQWERAHDRSLAAKGTVFHVHPGAVNLLDDVQMDELCETVTERGYRFVVFDTVAASLGGEEEGNPQFSKVVQNMRRVITAMHGEGAVFLVHHFGKDQSKGARGGSALFNDSDVFWELKGSRAAMAMQNTKWKTGKQRFPWRLRLDEADEATVCIKADTSAASVSVKGDIEDKHTILCRKIIEICERRAAENQGYGPSRNVIVGTLREMNVKFADADIRPALELLVADRRLLVHQGSQRSQQYRLKHAQDAIPGIDDDL